MGLWITNFVIPDLCKLSVAEFKNSYNGPVTVSSQVVYALKDCLNKMYVLKLHLKCTNTLVYLCYQWFPSTF